MKEILITSSVLIAVIALVRTLLKRRLSPTYRYFLWLLVALRLFIPITLFPSPVSVLNGVTDIKQTIVTTKVPIVPVSPQAPTTISLPGTGGTGTGGVRPNTPAAPDVPAVSIAPPDVDAVLHVLWLSGVGVMAIWFLTSDVRFRRRLRHTRKAVEGVGCPLPVYVTEAVPSPCLYGLFRPAIYLTPHCLEREETLRHVLTHESTHFRHGDHIWSLARCICLAIYWFNPLVWLAAVLSRQDCELACDEDAIRALGEGERAPYGRTLLSMVVPKVTAGDFLRTATTMTSGKKELRERITFIAKKPKQALLALAVAALIVGVAVSCTFTGAEVSKEPAVAQEVQGRLEEMLGEAGKLNVGLGYSTPQGSGRRLLDAKKEDGAYYVDKMLDYTWEVLPAGILWEPEKYDYDVEIRNHMVGELNFYGDSDIVRFLNGDNAVWYRATPMSADTQNIAALMREWYDDTLHNDSEMYDPLYIEEVGATLLLPKSWAGNYVVEKTPGESGFYLAQKDFLAGEWGTRADGTEGPIPDPEGGFVSLIEFDVQAKEDYLATFGHIGGHNGLWLGERDGLYYLIWFPTSFSSGDTVNAEEKTALYNKLMDDIVAYPGDASDYFIFDP